MILIGFVMGLFGGLLGIGGSIVMIPALVLFFGIGQGQKQHLYQASAMICNFFVASSAVLAHKKTKVLMPQIIKLLIPLAVAGVILGVLFSNLSFFAGTRSYILTRIFGGFMLYVAGYNCLKFFDKREDDTGLDTSNIRQSVSLTTLVGLASGFAAGLLGIGGGSVCVPLQQVTLKMPIKRAIANSAATIILIAAIGATLKNATLAQHGLAITDSIKIAIMVIPTAILGGFIGARLMHIMPKNIVRIAFILLMLAASYRLLTVAPTG
ncbi:MAG: sulfite exporter TauE/SafE family protein [Sedimentisphaerales bacterium]|nr:sulfite exporter TauE/SafE family protein [Sedimentisphaerales bacterium]